METTSTATMVRLLETAREVMKQIQIIGVVVNGVEHVKGKGKRAKLIYKGSVVWSLSSLSSLMTHS